MLLNIMILRYILKSVYCYDKSEFSHIWVYIIYICWWHTKVLLIIKWYTNSTQKKIFSSSPPQFPCTQIPSITDFSYIWCFINFYYFYDPSCNRKCIQCVTKKLPDLRKRIFSELTCYENISMTTAVPRGVKIILLNHAQVKHVMSIFVPSPKKGGKGTIKHQHWRVPEMFSAVVKMLVQVYQVKCIVLWRIQEF